MMRRAEARRLRRNRPPSGAQRATQVARYYDGRDLMYAGAVRAGIPSEFRRALIAYFEEMH
jgi:hypothetical protein